MLFVFVPFSDLGQTRLATGAAANLSGLQRPHKDDAHHHLECSSSYLPDSALPCVLG